MHESTEAPDDSQFTSEAKRVVPEREAWLWENEDAKNMVDRGLEAARNGELSDGPDRSAEGAKTRKRADKAMRETMAEAQKLEEELRDAGKKVVHSVQVRDTLRKMGAAREDGYDSMEEVLRDAAGLAATKSKATYKRIRAFADGHTKRKQ
jgi:hypothetical protein